MHGLIENELSRVKINALNFYSNSFNKDTLSIEVMKRINIENRTDKNTNRNIKFNNRDNEITLKI